MGLCLYVLAADTGDGADPEELGECEVGHYCDFGCFRDTIAAKLNSDRYPTPMQHSDGDGEWTLAEIPRLERGLSEIGERLRHMPHEDASSAVGPTAEYRSRERSPYDFFHDVNVENLCASMLALCALARGHGRPITFM